MSERIVQKWKIVARYLRPHSLQSCDIARIEHTYSHNLTDQSAVLLESWRKTHGKLATIRLLCESLLDAGCRLHAEDVFGEDLVERVALELKPSENGRINRVDWL